MEFPFGHHHRRDPEEDERRERPPPYFGQPPPPPQPYYQENEYAAPPPPRPVPPPYYQEPEFSLPPPPPRPYHQESHVSHVHHSTDRPEGFGSFNYQQPPPPEPTHVRHVYHASHDKPEGLGSFNYQQSPPPPPAAASGAVHVSHVSHEKTETGHHHSFLHHHSHSGSGPAPFPALSGKPTVRFFCKAEPNFSLTIRNGKVVLAPSDPSDQFQHWYKDERLSTRVKDEEGFPCFALVNKVTGQAVKHSIGATHPVQLIPYNPDVLDESVLWTESKDIGDGYRAMLFMVIRNLVVSMMAPPLCFGNGTREITSDGGLSPTDCGIGTVIYCSCIVLSLQNGLQLRLEDLNKYRHDDDDVKRSNQSHGSSHPPYDQSPSSYHEDSGSTPLNMEEGHQPTPIQWAMGLLVTDTTLWQIQCRTHDVAWNPLSWRVQWRTDIEWDTRRQRIQRSTDRMRPHGSNYGNNQPKHNNTSSNKTNFFHSKHWYKDQRCSTEVKDSEGCPRVAMVNKATNLAMKHGKGPTEPVRLEPYDPSDEKDVTLLWTQSQDFGDGYRTIKMGLMAVADTMHHLHRMESAVDIAC
ncbi:Hydroxyproline-rich glycoprotein family protein [Citrus sinensis]|uniref:Hydroxyproline-rich glycoprotein family protein n=1 Tax=Citrus sinensis TaxID=2711 RepID=A0ACB8MEL9_CITSI|nr:Hydroxyproline-rich glycoprotein family protein [Citrus sinensis]